jgi:hypothetical protein
MSDTDHYTTPGPYLEPIRRYYDGPIGFDPCSNMASIVNATVEFTEEENGLRDWQGLQDGFINCPYSPGNLPRWVAHTYEQSISHGIRCLMLIPVSTSTKWWHRYVRRADWILYYEGRISFGSKLVTSTNDQNRHDSCLVGFDRFFNLNRLMECFEPQGWLNWKGNNYV